MKTTATVGAIQWVAWLSLALAACGGDDDARVAEPPPAVAWPTLDCDPLVPAYCGYPFPSNVYTVDDAATPTGRRVHFAPAMMPVANNGALSSPEPFGRSDGFSSAGALLALLPGAVLTGAAGPNDIARSLEADSPTVILDAETGERKAHFVDLDVGGTGPEDTTVMIRPAERLDDGKRYIVAIRGLVATDGTPIEPSPAFRQLRDLQATDDASVEARRPLYADIFGRLATAGIARETLQLAWDFTTASRENNTGWMVHMRDEALAMVGEDGPPFTITSVEMDPDERVAFAIRGTFEVPLYVDDHEPGGRLVFGEDGLPEPVGTHPVKFGLLIPKSAETTPAALLQYGHGLLGSFNQATGGAFRDLIDDYGYAIFGVTMWGMGQDIDGEWEDALWIADRLSDGEIDALASMYDRLHQGMLNQLLAMRMMRAGMAADPTYGPLLDADARYYHGISQGGIFGGTYMALSTDVERGVLGVMGMPYNLLLDRSVDFNPFFALMKFSFPDARDRALILGMIQLLWDRTEPNGYVPYLAGDTLPDTPPHSVLMRAAVGDHQVPTLGAHLMARAAGAVHLESGVRPIWGLQAVDAADAGSSYVEYDFGLPEVPACNQPMAACDDPHGKVRGLDAAKQQLDRFLRTGESQNFCDEGSCVFPELSGCDAGEEAKACP